MNIKSLLLFWAAVAVGTVAVTLLILTRETSPPTVPRAAVIESRPLIEQASDQSKPPAPETLPSEPPRTPASQPVRPAVPKPDPRFNDPAFKEQLGRRALSYVGADPAADELWASLIYDTSLSETVREDLMEDLNENGFSGGDGSVATVDDLPLIENRLALLEEHMADADEFMLAHLGEAYKDLVNMYVRLSQQ